MTIKTVYDMVSLASEIVHRIVIALETINEHDKQNGCSLPLNFDANVTAAREAINNFMGAIDKACAETKE